MELINGIEKKEYFRNYMREYYKNNKEKVQNGKVNIKRITWKILRNIRNSIERSIKMS